MGQFNSEKHHLVVAMNALMWLSRNGLLILDSAGTQGKKLVWIETKVNSVIDDFIPKIYEEISKN